MRSAHALEALLARALRGLLRALPRRGALWLGSRLGDLARALGIRRQVARSNLALAFPERSARERERILAAHYRDLGMVLCEMARGRASSHAPAGEVVADTRGLEHLEAARRAGRGAILLTGHYGDFGLLGAWLGRTNPVDVFSQALSNPAVDALVTRICEEGDLRRVPLGHGLRQLVEGLRENRWALILSDQDAGRRGIFVPFMGRPCSTSPMPARLSLRTGAPIIMGFVTRRPDHRHEIELLPPLTIERPDAPDAVARLTALHTALLERRVREHPEMWFWLHRRWKTAPPSLASVATGAAGSAPAAADAPVARGA